MSTKGSVPSAATRPPARATGPPPKRSGRAARGDHRQRGADALRCEQQAGADRVSPRTVWKYSGMRIIAPKSAAPRQKVETDAAAKALFA